MTSRAGKMLTAEEVEKELRRPESFSVLSGAKYIQILDTLAAALKVVEAAKDREKNYMNGCQLCIALEPFQGDD